MSIMKTMDVLTNRYDNLRQGANLNETILTQDNVNVNDFGKVFTRGVDGQIYAQPLIVSNVNLPRTGRRSIVIVATTRNMAYAFFFFSSRRRHTRWRTNLDNDAATPVPRTDYGPTYQDFTSEIGVSSTPVIDREGRIIYLTAKSKRIVKNKPHFRYQLYALDLLTGKAKLRSP